MGKTRLLAELAHEAHGAGRTVLYGRAEACSPIPYQPFVDALRHHVAHDAALETAGLEPELAAVADVMPELRERFPHSPVTRRTGGYSPGLRRSSRSSGGPGRCCSCSTTSTTRGPRPCGSCAT